MTRLRLLLADDSAEFLEALRAWLGEDPRVEIVGVASSGEEAVALAARRSPDLVLMDLKMPGIGGIEATRLLKRGGPAPRVIVVTLEPLESLRRAAMEAGADHFVAKERLGEELPLLFDALAHRGRESNSP